MLAVKLSQYARCEGDRERKGTVATSDLGIDEVDRDWAVKTGTAELVANADNVPRWPERTSGL